MDRSVYLTQALQEIAGQPVAPAASAPDLQAMAEAAKARKSWEAANPGQSYMAHGFKQMGQSTTAAPGNAMSGFANLAALLKGAK